MDIFTSVLTRVVPVPIKKHDNKIKAMAKITRLSKLSDDILGVEDHHQYPTNARSEKSPKESSQEIEKEIKQSVGVYESNSNEENDSKPDQIKIKHIDEYI